MYPLGHAIPLKQSTGAICLVLWAYPRGKLLAVYIYISAALQRVINSSAGSGVASDYSMLMNPEELDPLLDRRWKAMTRSRTFVCMGDGSDNSLGSPSKRPSRASSLRRYSSFPHCSIVMFCTPPLLQRRGLRSLLDSKVQPESESIEIYILPRLVVAIVSIVADTYSGRPEARQPRCKLV